MREQETQFIYPFINSFNGSVHSLTYQTQPIGRYLLPSSWSHKDGLLSPSAPPPPPEFCMEGNFKIKIFFTLYPQHCRVNNQFSTKSGRQRIQKSREHIIINICNKYMLLNSTSSMYNVYIFCKLKLWAGTMQEQKYIFKRPHFTLQAAARFHANT